MNLNATVEGRETKVEGQNPGTSGRHSTLDPRPSTDKSGVRGFGNPKSEIRNPKSERGIALIITLILLSVVTFMALAFLALSRRERSAVATVTDTAGAQYAADAALAQAEAQVLANVLATTNPFNFGLLVSTNYINPVGFQQNVSSFTNVNYDHLYNSSLPLGIPDFLQNLANLWYSPRPPVFIPNPTNPSLPSDFRYYLDLNRNGRYDTNGWVTNVYNNGVGLGTANFQVGDPEWIGVLQRPDAPYGPNNPFIARYAFIAVPVGNTLDLNAIHNQVFDEPSTVSPGLISVNPGANTSDGFFRNQGVGSWEINLAAFLADLNTNNWDADPNFPATYYQYNQPISANLGHAFEDARALLTWRYNNNYNTLNSVFNLYGGSGQVAFNFDNIDGYSDGPLQTGFQMPGDVTVPKQNDNASLPWAGADNTNYFFSEQELFNPAETEMGVAQPPVAPGFIERLNQAGTNASTYDRYTFYRLLSQLGTDTTPESGKMNLNYNNLDGVVVIKQTPIGNTTNTIPPAASTNFFGWTNSVQFFTNAADRMLRAYTTQWRNANPTNFAATFYATYNFTNFVNSDQWTNYPAFGITNIPVLVGSQFVYSPAVNRLLQLAANIYDATTNRYYDNLQPLTPLPTVFRPYFNMTVTPTTTNVYICGFTEVTNVNEADLPLSRPYNLYNPNDLAQLRTTGPNYINVYGVPMIIGAKKGFPNFNEFYMESAFQLTRKLMVTRQSTTVPSPPPSPTSSFFGYYVMYNLSLTNQFGVECWNSYRSNYTRSLDIYATNFLVMTLTNDENSFTSTTNLIAGGILQFPNSTNLVWPLYDPSSYAPSFQIPLATNFAAVPASRYLFNGGSPYLSTNLNLWYETNGTGFGQYPQPRWGLTLTNNLQVIMVDHTTGRLIDYVQLSGPNSIRDLGTEIQSGYDKVGSGNNTGYNDLWDTNLIGGVPNGFAWQFNVSKGKGNPIWSTSLWGSDQQSAYDQMNAFIVFTEGSSALTLTFPGYISHPDQIAAAKMTNAMQMAYTPTATVVQDIVWQANDPLVHYMASDLVNATNSFTGSPFNWYNNYTYVDNFTTQPGSGFQIFLNWPGNLGQVNQRYMPWGVNPMTGAGTNLSAIKDPLVTGSDDWDFPKGKFPTVGWLGRVHRGTPWQTVYLKASDVLSYSANFNSYGNNGPDLWMNRWTGDVNPYDATNTAPVQDRLLFDLFTTAFNDNATRGTLSVNVGPTNANLAAWSALFSGIVVPTSLTNSYTIISPAGTLGAGSPLWQMVTNINMTRANFTNADGVVGSFEHVGNILAAQMLTEQLPFFAGLDPNTQISDEMYEWLPQQTMSLMRASSSPRYVIYCYGQALKPAPNGVYEGSGPFFGMVTNYQIVSEIATRAVVRFNSSLTNPPPTLITTPTNSYWISTPPVVTNNNAVIEQFNVLPPD